MSAFKCDKCGCHPDELWSFTQFGNNQAKIDDNKEYCKECFDKVEEKYDNTTK